MEERVKIIKGTFFLTKNKLLPFKFSVKSTEEWHSIFCIFAEKECPSFQKFWLNGSYFVKLSNFQILPKISEFLSIPNYGVKYL